MEVVDYQSGQDCEVRSASQGFAFFLLFRNAEVSVELVSVYPNANFDLLADDPS